MPDHVCAWVCQSHAHNSHSCYFSVCAFTWKQSKYLPQAVCISWITLSWSLLGTEWRTCNLQWVSQMWCWSKEPRHDTACSVSFCRWKVQKEAKTPILHEIGTPCLQGGSVEEAKGNTWGPTPFWLPQIEWHCWVHTGRMFQSAWWFCAHKEERWCTQGQPFISECLPGLGYCEVCVVTEGEDAEE